MHDTYLGTASSTSRMFYSQRYVSFQVKYTDRDADRVRLSTHQLIVVRAAK